MTSCRIQYTEIFLRYWDSICEKIFSHPTMWFHEVVPFSVFSTLRPRQNGRNFPDDIFLNENVWISIKISLKLVPTCPIGDIASLVQIMAWRRPGEKPLSEPVMVRIPTHICVTRPQWVNKLLANQRSFLIGQVLAQHEPWRQRRKMTQITISVQWNRPYYGIVKAPANTMIFTEPVASIPVHNKAFACRI